MTPFLLSNIITLIFLFVGGLWLRNFLPNYFNEKGKLLAQKKDIAEITEKIESVKIEFTRDTEVLKSSLQRLISLETSHRTEERNAIIDFYSKYNQWLYALLEINYGAYSRLNVKDLTEKRIYIEKFYGETGVAQSKVQLLVQNEEIVAISHKLYLSILEFKHWFDERLLLLQQNIENQIFQVETFIPLMKKLEENKDKMLEMAKEEKDLQRQLKELVPYFYSNRTEQHKKIIPVDLLFTDRVKKYLPK
jgi:hypothetical protein